MQPQGSNAEILNPQLVSIEAHEVSSSLESHHDNNVYPITSARVCTLAAHASANTFSDWTEITDGTQTLSSKFATKSGYISSMVIEAMATKDKRAIVELSYGVAKVVIGRIRFMSAGTQLNTRMDTRFRGLLVPAGETVYYRMMCETGAATAEVMFRWWTTT